MFSIVLSELQGIGGGGVPCSWKKGPVNVNKSEFGIKGRLEGLGPSMRMELSLGY